MFTRGYTSAPQRRFRLQPGAIGRPFKLPGLMVVFALVTVLALLGWVAVLVAASVIYIVEGDE